MSGDPAKFKANELVMAMDPKFGRAYEAKILKVHELPGVGFKYFIHYQGWGQKHDCWMSETQLARKGDEKAIAKLNESAKLVVVVDGGGSKKKSKSGASSVEKAETADEGNDDLDADLDDDIDRFLEEEAAKDEEEEEGQRNSHRKRGRPRAGLGVGGAQKSASAGSQPTPTNRQQKVYKDPYQLQLHRRVMHIADLVDLDDDESAEDPFAKKLEIPVSLKKHLVDEWGLVTQDPKRLLKLPRLISVREVINDFLETRKGKVVDDVFMRYKELFEGLLLYFNRALPLILLFKLEREQYGKLSTKFNIGEAGGVSGSTLPSQIYGAEHLLRLFVKIPRLAHDNPAIDMNIQNRLVEFLKFLSKNAAKYFAVSDYLLVEEATAHIESLSGDLYDVRVARSPSGRVDRQKKKAPLDD